MRKLIFIYVLVLFALLLTSCAGTPQSREAGRTLEVGVLGAEPSGNDLRLLATAGSGTEKENKLCQGTGATPAAAMEELAGSGDQVVSAAHVEHLMVTETAAALLPELLDYAFRDPLLSTETQLWVVEGEELEPLFQEDPAGRMEVLKTAGGNRQGFCPLTIREAAGAVAIGEPVLLPSLDPVTLERTGAVLYDGKQFPFRLDLDEALGASLLMGHRIHWTASEGEEAMSLRLARCALEPVFEKGQLAGLSVRCILDGVPVGGGAAGTDALEEQTARQIEAALEKLKLSNGGRLLLGRAGLKDPVRWRKLAGQWDKGFPGLDTEVLVTIRREA